MPYSITHLEFRRLELSNTYKIRTLSLHTFPLLSSTINYEITFYFQRHSLPILNSGQFSFPITQLILNPIGCETYQVHKLYHFKYSIFLLLPFSHTGKGKLRNDISTSELKYKSLSFLYQFKREITTRCSP